ncbi:MAG: ABC transporter permease [Clostridia bacterium]|nr:ABC transporter permease [Clostridia bacterium]
MTQQPFSKLGFVDKLLIVKPYLIVFFIPILFTLLFGYVMGPVYVQGVPFAIYDMDNSETSRSVVDSFYDCPTFKITQDYETTDQLEEALLQSDIYGAVIIPEGFGNDIQNKRGAEATVLVDGTNFQISNNLQQFATTIFTMAGASIQMKYLEAGEMTPKQASDSVLSLNIVSRNVYNPGLGYIYYLMPGLLGIFIQQSYLAVAPNAVIETKRSIRKMLMLSDTEKIRGSVASLTEQLLAFAGLSTISYLLSILILHYSYGFPLNGSLGLILLLQFVFIIDIAAMSIVIGTIFEMGVHVVQFTMFLTVPSILTCGFGWPEFMMTKLFAVIVKSVWPLYYYVIPLRNLLLKDADFSVIQSYIFGGIIFGAVWMVIGCFLFYNKVNMLRKLNIALDD